MLRALKLTPLLLLLGGCYVPTPQDAGGITKLKYDPTTHSIDYLGGKEIGNLKAKIKKQPDGTIDIDIQIGDVKAFEGQAIQADRLAQQTAVTAAVFQQMAPGMIRAALCGAGIVTACAPQVGQPTPLTPGN